MGNETKIIEQEFAKIPQNMGDYDELVQQGVTSFGVKERVNRYGCEFESTVENNTYAPATLVNGVVTPDTAHWRLVTGIPGNYGLDGKFAEMREELDTEKGKTAALEEAVGTGGSVDFRISSAVSAEASRAQTAEADRYTKSETYTKEEVHNLITTPNQKYASVTATAQTTAVTDVLPATGAADTTYRVGNWDGTQYNDSVFSEYAWNGSAYIKLSTKSQAVEVYDISANHAGTKYADLAAALGANGANIPQSLRKGGMSIKFVRSSDNKYVQFRLMNQNWSTTVADWQGVDDEPTAGSENLAKSGGVVQKTIDVIGKLNNSINIEYIIEPKIGGLLNRSTGNILFDKVQNSNHAYCVEFFPVIGNSKIKVTAYSTAAGAGVVFYDANKTYISAQTGGENIVIDVPASASYVRISTEVYGTKGLALISLTDNIDAVPTLGSEHFVKSGGVKDAIEAEEQRASESLEEAVDNIILYVDDSLGKALKQETTDIIVNVEEGETVFLSSETDNTVLHYSKNILEYDSFYRKGVYEIEGITFTNNGDGTISVKGTATDNAKYYIVADNPSSLRLPIKAGTYTLSGCPNKDDSVGYYLRLGLTGIGEKADFGEGNTFTISEDTTYYLFFSVRSGKTVDFVVTPQIEHGNKKTSFVKGEKESIEVEGGKIVKVDAYEESNRFTSENKFLIIRDKNNNSIVHLKKYAVGDGVSDDTNAINEALSEAEGKVLIVDEGTYLFSGTLNIKTGTHIVGYGKKSVFQLADNYTLTPFEWRPYLGGKYMYRYPYMVTAENSENCILDNFTVYGQTTGLVDENEDAIAIRGSRHVVKNLFIKNINYYPDDFTSRTCVTPGYGINVFKASYITVQNCWAENCGYQDFGVEESEYITIDKCFGGYACQTCFQVHANSHHITISDCHGHGYKSSCMTFDANPDVAMSDIRIINNVFDGVLNFVAGGENNFFINNNFIKGISCNNREYRDLLILVNNYIHGQVNTWHHNALISNNIISAGGGYYMIQNHGKKAVIENNLAIGTAEAVKNVLPVYPVFSNWESGSINENYELVASDVYKVSSPVDISQYAGKQMKFTNSAYKTDLGTQPQFYSVFYDANNNPCDRIRIKAASNVENGEGYTVEQMVTIPSDAVSFRATYFDESKELPFEFTKFYCEIHL